MPETKNENAATFEELEKKKTEVKDLTWEDFRLLTEGKTVYITPYAHCDWSWSHSRNWHYIRYATSLDEVLDLMKENPDYTWYADSWITDILPYLKARPERIQELGDAIRRRKFELCGDYSNVRINMVADEAMVRNMIYGRREIGNWFPEADPIVNGAYVDVAPGGPQTPQIMKKGGYRYYRFNRPSALLAEKGIPHDFIWRGADGTEILCWWGSYGGWWLKELADRDIDGDWEGTVRWIYKHEFPAVTDLDARFHGLNATDVILSANGSDDSRPLRSHNGNALIDLPKIIRRWNETQPSVLRFATPREAFEAIEQQRDRLPVWEGSLDPCDVAYNCAWAGEQGLLQIRIGGAEAIVRAEKWSSAAACLAGKPYPSFDAEWKDNLKISAHASQDIFEWDYEEFRKWGKQAESSAEAKAELAIDALAERIDAPDNTVAIVFNPHDKTVTAPVTLTVPADRFETLRLFDGAGHEIPYQIETPLFYNHIWECRLRCLITLPPVGYTCVTAEGADLSVRNADPDLLNRILPQLDQPAPEEFEIDNGRYVFRFRRGDLIRIVRRDGTVLNEAQTAPWNRIEFRHTNSRAGVLMNGPITDRHRVEWDSQRILLNGPVVWEVLLSGSDGTARYTQKITFLRDSGRVDFETRTYWDHEGLLVAGIPMPPDAPLFGGVMFGMEEKKLDAEHYDAIEQPTPEMDFHRFRPGLFYAKNVAFYRTGAASVSLTNREGDRYFIRNRPDETLEYLLISSIDRGPFDGVHTWKEHVSALSMTGKGDHCFRYGFRLDEPDVPAETVLSEAAAFRDPVTVRRVPGAVFVSALYRDGDAYILRVYVSVGKPKRTVSVSLPFTPLRAVVQDFIGRPDCLKAVAIEKNRVSFAIEPFEIVTLRMTSELPDDRIG